jgi:SAM (Sterile alpha motif) domain-containing protein
MVEGALDAARNGVSERRPNSTRLAMGSNDAELHVGYPMDVDEWLRGLGFVHYAQAFRDNNIDGRARRSLPMTPFPPLISCYC